MDRDGSHGLCISALEKAAKKGDSPVVGSGWMYVKGRRVG